MSLNVITTITVITRYKIYMQCYIMANLPKYRCYGKVTVGPFYCCWLRFICQRYKIFHCCHGTATEGSYCPSYPATIYFVLSLTIIGTKYYEYIFLHLAFVIRHANCIFSAPYYIVVCGISSSTIFFLHCLINRITFGKMY
jgi:hypothetical protein